MEAFNLFAQSLVEIFTSPTYLLYMAAFTAIGILLGAMPGISVTMSMVLSLPMTYGMDTKMAMCVLLACYVGAMSGGLISAIALNIPGTGASITTTFDGHPLARQGKGGQAIGIGLLTSFVGGSLGFILLVFLAPLIAKVALAFGPWEYFVIGVFSIVLIITSASDDLLKGTIASLFGMALSLTGSAPVSLVARFNFGNHALDNGVTTTALLCGIFALPELYSLVAKRDAEEAETMQFEKFSGFGIRAEEYLAQWKNIIRSTLIGAYVGVLPGVGGSSASLLSWMTARKRSKEPENLGMALLRGLLLLKQLITHASAAQ